MALGCATNEESTVVFGVINCENKINGENINTINTALAKKIDFLHMIIYYYTLNDKKLIMFSDTLSLSDSII